jgi:hypothetical protein
MTRKEFERLRISIEGEAFLGDYTNPLEYGIQRAAFEKRKFQKLISAAGKVNMRTTRAKAEQWQRQLEKSQVSHDRFKALKKEMDAAKIHIDLISIPTVSPKNQTRL